MSKIQVVSRSKARPGKEEEAKQMITAGAGEAKANEPGASRFQCFVNEAGNEFTTLESYEDAEAMRAHVAGLVQNADQRGEVIQNQSFEIYGDVPPDLKETLQRFGPTLCSLMVTTDE